MSRPHPLLLTLAAGHLPEREEPIDDRLVKSAMEHRMQGLLWEWIDAGLVTCDEQIRASLAMVVLGLRRRSQRMFESILEIGQTLASRDLDFAVLKGVGVERRWYSGPGSRPAGDIDLWLAPHQLHRVREAVSMIQPDHPLVEDVAELVARHRLRSIDLRWKDFPVDLHFDPFKYGVWFEDLDSLWARSRPIDEGVRFTTEEVELVLSLLHLNKDRFARLLGFVDVMRIASDSEVCTAAWSLTERVGAQVPVASAASVVETTLGMCFDLPDPEPGLRTAVWNSVWPERIRLLGEDGLNRMRRRQDWIPLLCEGHVGDALRYLRHVWFPPKRLLEYFNPHVTGLSYPAALWKARTGAARAKRADRPATEARAS
jgi:hypothetical protein